MARWKESRDREAHCWADRANYQPVVDRPHDFAAAATELEQAMQRGQTGAGQLARAETGETGASRVPSAVSR